VKKTGVNEETNFMRIKLPPSNEASMFKLSPKSTNFNQVSFEEPQ